MLGWTRPKLRDPAAADRWTWLIIACYAQLRLARHLAADIRLPWQQPCPPGRLTPARVRSGFRSIHQALPCLASAPKPGQPGPGRPPGSKNRQPATRHDAGKTAKRDQPKKKTAGRRVKQQGKGVRPPGSGAPGPRGSWSPGLPGSSSPGAPGTGGRGTGRGTCYGSSPGGTSRGVYGMRGLLEETPLAPRSPAGLPGEGSGPSFPQPGSVPP